MWAAIGECKSADHRLSSRRGQTFFKEAENAASRFLSAEESSFRGAGFARDPGIQEHERMKSLV
jgi:hypothetical protein